MLNIRFYFYNYLQLPTIIIIIVYEMFKKITCFKKLKPKKAFKIKCSGSENSNTLTWR